MDELISIIVPVYNVQNYIEKCIITEDTVKNNGEPQLIINTERQSTVRRKRVPVNKKANVG